MPVQSPRREDDASISGTPHLTSFQCECVLGLFRLRINCGHAIRGCQPRRRLGNHTLFDVPPLFWPTLCARTYVPSVYGLALHQRVCLDSLISYLPNLLKKSYQNQILWITVIISILLQIS